jgi:putative pyruvate formate lyase activating enzyme
VGTRGSGTVFFSHCNLSCVYCQNHRISSEGFGREVTTERLACILLDIGARAENVNLVSPTHYAPVVTEAVRIAKASGLRVPVVWNSNAYESPETIQALNSLVDIYLPDLKYFSEESAVRYSAVPGYFAAASRAIEEMNAQVGEVQTDGRGVARKGLIIRHLVLPGLVEESLAVLEWVRTRLGRRTWVSLMAQYCPAHRAGDYPEIARPILTAEYQAVVERFIELGFEGGYCQERSAASLAFVPDFDLSGMDPVDRADPPSALKVPNSEPCHSSF